MRRLLPLLTLLLLLASCAKEQKTDTSLYSTTRWTEFKVAIVAPLTESEEYRERIERIADWFSQEFHEGQKTLEQGAVLKFEWYDETSMTASDLEKLGSDFASRTDLAAVVGPFYSTSVEVVASKMYLADIPLFVPVMTSEEVQRRYSVATTGRIRSPFMWCLSECDVAQSEVLMGMIASYGYNVEHPDSIPSMALIATDDSYGKTFTEWVPYQAVGMDSELKLNCQYKAGDVKSISESVDQLAGCGVNYAIIAAATVADAEEFVRQVRGRGKKMPRIFFTDVTFNASFLSDPELAESAEGVTMYADPESGFLFSYQARFGELPTPDECMMYDALLLAGMACEYSLLTDMENLNSIVAHFSSADGAPAVNAWNSVGVREYLTQALSTGCASPIRGVSGKLRFDPESFTTRVSSEYALWRVFEGKFVIMSLVSTETVESISKWSSLSHYKNNYQEFNEDIHIQYGPMKDRWAVLVCSSGGWLNYRHVADVLGVYQMLKVRNYDDDHIILVMTDDLSQNARNTYPGEIRSTWDGNNLLEGAVVDYDQKSITASDVCDILLGRSSDRLPTVLKSDSCSNVFIYWSSHGYEGGFNWTGGDAMTSEMFGNTVREMYDRKMYRQMLICTEPCHSASVLNAIENCPGVLGIASAYETESSFADVYDAELGTWLSDRFTNNLLNSLGRERWQIVNPSYWDLYRSLREHTIGSHVKVINSDLFGNLYEDNVYDFFYESE